MFLLRRYRRFLYRRLWGAGKYASLSEVRLQMIPWIGATLLLTVVSSFLDFEPYSYQIFATAFVVLSPMAVGVFIIYRVSWHVSCKRIRLEPFIQNNDD
jgi:hypothetical protein